MISSGRKPAHLMPSGTPTHREAVWVQVRRLKTFTSREIKNAARIKQLNLDAIQYYLRGWVRSGHLEIQQKANPRKYALKIDTGVNPPRVNIKGEPITQGKSRLQMWTALRIQRQCNYRELAVLASTDECVVSINDAEDYLQNLYKAGYLVRVSAPCTSGKIASYTLKPAMNTGPKPPLVQRTQVVIDQNLRQVVWPRGEEVQGDY